MKAVIFAAGLGTRLRPLTDELPKTLIDVGGKPILQRTLEALPDAVDEAIVVIGHKGDLIRDRLFHLGTIGRRIVAVEQSELKGTHDALFCAKNMLGGGPFLALNGDDLYAKADLERLAVVSSWAVLAKTVPAPNPHSHLETEGGFLKGIVPNKDSTGLPARRVYTGACLLDETFFDLEPAELPNGECSLPHTLEKHLNKHPVQVVEAGFWMPVGTPEELRTARNMSELDTTAVSR